MTDSGVEADKQVVRDFIQAVWVRQDLTALDRFWTADCVNHAAPPGSDVGLEALRGYHEQFAAQFDGFSDTAIDVVQQVGEDDRVVTQLQTRARHTGDFAGVSATGKTVTLATIRIDRLAGGRISEHWSVADVADSFSNSTADDGDTPSENQASRSGERSSAGRTAACRAAFAFARGAGRG